MNLPASIHDFVVSRWVGRIAWQVVEPLVRVTETPLSIPAIPNALGHTGHEGARRRLRMKPLKVILLVVCFICVATFLYAAIASVIFPYDLDQYEGIVIEPALRLASGRPIYGQQLALGEPYLFATYGPLYYLVLGGLLKLTGLTFWPGRLLSLSATVATAWLLYQTVNRQQKTIAAGCVAGVLFIMTPVTWAFGFLQRVDALGIFFTTLCVALILFAGEKRRNLFFAGAAAAAAFLVKSILIAAPLAAIICLLIAGAFKELRAFLIGGAIILGLGAMALLTTGNAGYVFNQLIQAQTPFSIAQIVSNIRVLIQSHAAIAALAIGGALLFQTNLRNRQAANLLPLIYLIIAGGLGLAECGKAGAAVNYFYEFFVALALCAGLVMVKLEKERQVAYLLAAFFLIISLSAELALTSNYFIKNYLFVSFSKARLHEKIVQDLREYVPDGEVIASHYPDLVLRSGHPIYFSDISMYLLGPDAVRSPLSSNLGEKKIAAYVAMKYSIIPGYSLVKEAGYDPVYPPTGEFVRGPLLYLRDDLWQKTLAAAGSAP